MILTGSRVVLILLIACSIFLAIKEARPIKGDTDVTPYRVHLQTATAAELELLPGVGPKTAQSIVQYRQQHVLQLPDDLLGVYGIGQLTVDRLRHLTTKDIEVK